MYKTTVIGVGKSKHRKRFKLYAIIIRKTHYIAHFKSIITASRWGVVELNTIRNFFLSPLIKIMATTIIYTSHIYFFLMCSGYAVSLAHVLWYIAVL